MSKTRFSLAIVVLAATAAFAQTAPPQPQSDVKLVVSIVIDGLRYDTLHQGAAHLGPDGIRRLLRDGTDFAQANYQHSSTFTAVGHSTLYTGTYPPHHGIVGNYWFDPVTGDQVYAVGDPASPLVEDPANTKAGRSPANLLGTTFGDELVLATAGRARVFSVSGKDRGAILPGGHLGRAYWYDRHYAHFVTSTYYCRQYPDWVTAWNAADPAQQYRDALWRLLDHPDSYVHREDDRPGEKGFQHLGRTLPHALRGNDENAYRAVLHYTPFSDELLLAFTKELIAREHVGQGPDVDLLAISFSAMDYIQHAWGARSLEAEDNLRRVDRLLAELFNFLDQRVGLDHTLIALTADHGFDDIPEEWQRQHFSAGRHDPQELVTRANAALRVQFDTTADLVFAFWPPSMYLDLQAVAAAGLQVPQVETALARFMVRQPGIAYAATRSDLLAGQVPNDPVLRRVQQAFNPQRSGNVLIVQQQFWYLYTAPEDDATTHGSPYDYDTHVPLLVAGPGIPHGVVRRPVGIEMLAPTLSAYLGIAAPSGAGTETLTELLQP